MDNISTQPAPRAPGASRRGAETTFPFDVRRQLHRWGHRLARRAPWAFSAGEVESAVDLALVEAWHRFDPLRGRAFAAYARGWVRGAVARAVAQCGRARALLTRRGRVCELVSAAPSPEVVAAARQLAPAIATLSPRDRDILLRHVVHGEALLSIARQLGIDRTAAWRRYDLARAHLRGQPPRRARRR